MIIVGTNVGYPLAIVGMWQDGLAHNVYEVGELGSEYSNSFQITEAEREREQKDDTKVLQEKKGKTKLELTVRTQQKKAST